MKDAGLTSTREMFYGGYDSRNHKPYDLHNMIKISGMENLVTDKVTDMSDMFEGCKGLTSINLSSFNTEKVTNMSAMFSVCESLTSINLSSFNTANVTNMEFMFQWCDELTDLDLSHFNTEKVTDMSWMFYDCESLTSLDLSSFNIDNVMYMDGMFYGCSALETIWCNGDWSQSSAISDEMFSGCTSLVGGMGTTYDANHTDVAYAHPDGEDGKPGYFTSNEQLKPLPNDETTTFDFSLYDPAGSELLGVTLGAKDQYNATEGRIEISTTNTEEEIDEKLNAAFAGAASFKSLLPGTITFKLEKGQGEIEIDCMTLPGYVLKVRIAKYGTAFISSTIEQAIRGKATVNYNVTQDTYVVIYLEGTSSATAPARIARSKKEEDSGAYVYSIVVTPKNTPTGVEPTFSDPSGNVKVMINGILYILHDGKIFTPTGVQVK